MSFLNRVGTYRHDLSLAEINMLCYVKNLKTSGNHLYSGMLKTVYLISMVYSEVDSHGVGTLPKLTEKSFLQNNIHA